MKIAKYALAALAFTAISMPSLFQTSHAADEVDGAGSFYVKFKGGYNRSNTKKMAYGTMGYAAAVAESSAGAGDAVAEKLGVAHDGIEYDKMEGPALSAAIGYRLSDSVRSEASYTYSKTKMRVTDKNAVTTEFGNTGHEMMVSAFYDIAVSDCFTPYIGLGVGYLHSSDRIGDLDTSSANAAATALNTVKRMDRAKFKSDSALAGKLEAGIQVPVADGVRLEGSYTLKGRTVSEYKDAASASPEGTLSFYDATNTAITTGTPVTTDFTRSKPKAVSHEVSGGIAISF